MSEEKVEQLIAILERLEKAGTLKEFLKEAPEAPRDELLNLLLFCGNTADCRDEFLELNKMQDVDEES